MKKLPLGGECVTALCRVNRRLAALDDPRTTAAYTMVVAFVVSTIAVPFF